MRPTDGTRATGGRAGLALALGFALLAGSLPCATADPPDAGTWPRSRASFGGRIESVIRLGDIAFIAEGQGISVTSLADPVRPGRIARIEIPGVVDDFDLYGDLAIVAVEDLGVEIHDVSDPRRPRKLAFLDHAGAPVIVAWGEAGRLWVGKGYGKPERYFVYSLADPANPRLEAEVHPDDLFPSEGGAAEEGRRPDEVEIASRLERWNPSAAEGDVGPPKSPLIERGFEFRTRTPGGILEGVHISPRKVLGVAAREPHLLLACGDAGLWTVTPRSESWPEVVAISDLGGYVSDCAVAGDFAYLASDSPVLGIVHLADPEHPVTWRFDSGDGIGTVRKIRLEDGRLHAITEGPEWILFDIENPFRPSVVARTPLHSSAADATLRGTLLLIADDRLRTIDLSDPSHPRELGSMPPQYSFGNEWDDRGLAPTSLAFVGDSLFASSRVGWNSDLARIDYADPSAPRLLERIEDERFGPILHVASGRFVMSWHRPNSGHRFHGIEIRAVDDPKREYGRLERLDEPPLDALAAFGRLWVAGGESGLLALSPWP